MKCFVCGKIQFSITRVKHNEIEIDLCDTCLKNKEYADWKFSIPSEDRRTVDPREIFANAVENK